MGFKNKPWMGAKWATKKLIEGGPKGFNKSFEWGSKGLQKKVWMKGQRGFKNKLWMGAKWVFKKINWGRSKGLQQKHEGRAKWASTKSFNGGQRGFKKLFEWRVKGASKINFEWGAKGLQKNSLREGQMGLKNIMKGGPNGLQQNHWMGANTFKASH